ncbi:MAG TPA: dihydrodipicolinate synthase family protein [Pyrinomonadaceae bacterium]|nr:dihydrodipicolinate synthase family protein [Pyrinomonadaceae bacterium]
MINLNGILLPVTTPFTADENVDLPGLTANIGRWSQTGVIGFVALGSTGERVNLDEREYLEVIETARRATRNPLSLIVGAGQQSTRGTINEIAKAARVGAEAVLVITPSFYKSAITQDALVKHYQAIADASPVPLLLYSMPDLTGVKIEPETAARLSEHPNIIGMKDSSNDVAKFAEAVRTTPEDFALMIGNGTVLCEALQAGARGGILAVGCAVPEHCLEIHRAVRAGETDRAATLQEKLTPLARAVTKTYGIGGLKAAMGLAGYVGGSVRAPLRSPGKEAGLEIEQLLAQAIEAVPQAEFAAASEARP